MSRESVVVMADPWHPYAVELARRFFDEHGLRTVFFYEDAKEAFYAGGLAAHTQAWVAATRVVKVHEFPEFARALRSDFVVAAVVPPSEASLSRVTALMRHLNAGWCAPHTLERFRDKQALKSFLEERAPHLRLGAGFRINSSADLVALRAQLPSRFVLKPNDGFGNREVGFFNAASFDEAVKFVSGGAVSAWVLEPFIDGEEFAVNGQVDAQGAVHVFTVSRYERVAGNGRPNLYFREWSLTPSDPLFLKFAGYARAVLAHTDLRGSPFHLELKCDEEGPCLIEVGARLVGHAGAHVVNDVCSGLDAFSIAARGYLGLPLEVPPIVDGPGFMVADGITTSEGFVSNLFGLDLVEQHPAFRRWVIKPRIGMKVRPTLSLFDIPWAAHFAGSPQALRDASSTFETALRATVASSSWDRLRLSAFDFARRGLRKAAWLAHRATM